MSNVLIGKITMSNGGTLSVIANRLHFFENVNITVTGQGYTSNIVTIDRVNDFFMLVFRKIGDIVTLHLNVN